MKTLEDALAAIEEMRANQEALVAAHEAEKQKILAKNAELIQREKEAKSAVEREALEKEAEKEAKLLASADAEARSKTWEAKYQREVEKLNKHISDLTAERDNSKVSALIEQAIGKNGILEPAQELMRAHLSMGVSVKDGVAMRGDRPLEDFITDYMSSDQAKHFKAAAENSGGGATGGVRTAAPHGFNKDNFSAKKSEWLLLAKTNPEEAKAIAIEAGQIALAKTL